MKEFSTLVDLLGHLMGPNGCPWDRKQTMTSIRSAVLEEVYELIDAIDLNDNKKILEELGDLLFGVTFMGLLAEKEQRGSFAKCIEGINEKLIRRHPHVFGENKLETSEEVLHQWEQIKRKEKEDANAQIAVLHDIPKGMSSLLRAQRILRKTAQVGFPHKHEKPEKVDDERSLGEGLLHLVSQAQKKGLNAEVALNKALANEEAAFLKWEESSKHK